MLEIISNMNEIIRLQTEIIDRSVKLLLQHIQTDDETLSEILVQREQIRNMILKIEADPITDEGLPF